MLISKPALDCASKGTQAAKADGNKLIIPQRCSLHIQAGARLHGAAGAAVVVMVNIIPAYIMIIMYSIAIE